MSLNIGGSLYKFQGASTQVAEIKYAIFKNPVNQAPVATSI